ncbi:MAG: TrkA C-terminal domain-containing protein [Calditrichaceae bacterium]
MDIVQYLQTHQTALIFLIITLGFLFGRIRILDFSFEASGILFVAMVFGHYGFTLNSDFQMFGLILFIYAIGLQAGPSIFNISKKQGLQLYILVFIVISAGAITTVVAAKIWHVDMPLAIGLFAGALTSTPGLASAQETTQSALTSTGYGLAYPFGVIGVILFLKLLPVIMKVNIKKEEDSERESHKAAQKPVVHKHVLITNHEMEGKSLAELNFNRITGTIISRIMHGRDVIAPGASTILHTNDIVRIVGTEDQLKVAIPFLGKLTDAKFPEVKYFESRRFVVTNKDVIGKTISELNLHSYYNINVTRIRRGGLEFTAEPDQRLSWGDRIRVAGDASHMDDVGELLGNEMKKVEFGDIFSIFMGMLLGIIAGLIPFSIGKAISFNLGITGGVLLAGLFLSNRGKVGPVIWQVPVPITAIIRELGLTLFLAVVGIKAGAEVLNTIKADGLKLVVIGSFITIFPMVMVSLIARTKYKIKLLELYGIISGGMTSTPGLAVATGATDSQTPLIIYATVYPAAMILMMIWVKILAFF